ncbi:prolyl-tRNA editing enzyme YbaK/EbsC (Cys-tRNA(Pro) deacylase) [Okibacterium sp. HSC-33S16]|uniref:YbaK/EbsC family protein n=1 Tax=Okibacterium sp. HSC-33S16 TaxID=2910965 RepID=UPI00209F2ED0|nr:YbaK/EbsC family protein [Okibacterium sp. HSC-33S16]MCP2030125.1 prolyl-tRNA editing enzyme YbaK/EbsC (Cys-tRNA(Pro) deacylase) [Okibacterium sp. HSC-33S16]
MTDSEPSHPSVARVLEQLRAGGIGGDVRWFEDATPTAVHAAEALGVDVGAIANSLIFTLDGEPVLVLTSGSHRVDTGWLGAQLGGTLKRADAATVRSATGQVIGGVAPVGHPQPVRTFVDTALANYPEVWAAAGHPHTVFPTTFDELVRLTGGTPLAVEPTAES